MEMLRLRMIAEYTIINWRSCCDYRSETESFWKKNSPSRKRIDWKSIPIALMSICAKCLCGHFTMDFVLPAACGQKSLRMDERAECKSIVLPTGVPVGIFCILGNILQ